MPDGINFKFTGGPELQRKLERLALQTAKKMVRQSLKAGAQVVLKAILAVAPRDTGFLAEHFGIRTSIRGKEIAGSAFVGPQGKIDYPGRQRSTPGRSGSKLRYIAVATVARFLEFGTSRMVPRPFMTQGFETSKQSALDRMIAKLKEVLDEDTR